MALLSAYATDAEYRNGVAGQATGTDAALNAQLIASSRLLERELGLSPGAFNEVTAQTYHFDGSGRARQSLRDRAGMAYFLQTIEADGLGIDVNYDGVADYTLDFNDAWLRGLPENAALGSEPYTSLELIPLATSTLRVFPALVANVSIKGTWGWHTVPDIIKELTIHLTHDLRLSLLAGTSARTADFGGMPVHALSPDTYWLWREAQARYSRRILAIA